MRTDPAFYWSDRAVGVTSDLEVNVADVFQRGLEYDYLCRHLTAEMSVLEAGCGNGYSTVRFRELVAHVDAFDVSEEMIRRAKERFGELNNRFLVDDILTPKHLERSYDTVICVRVLINLRDLAQQLRAIRNLAAHLTPGGLLLLAEGFSDGFVALSALRAEVGLPPVEPAIVNFYSRIDEVLPELERHFRIEGTFHLGAYDYLTRVVYPLVAGPDNARHNTVFSEKCATLAQAHNPNCFEPFSRMRGFVLRRRS